jgi:hypothetical protein
VTGRAIGVKALVVAAILVVTAAVGGQGALAAAPEGQAGASKRTPAPPQLPRDFRAKGRYIVADLGIDVPFTWEGRDGDSQMIAGGDDFPIYFTNVISGGQLYTLTYKWPGLARRPCSPVGAFSLDDLNQFLAKARYVGSETLHGAANRPVHHFRAGVVWEPPASVVPPDVLTPVGGTPDVGTGGAGPALRIPLMLGDFYVDRHDPEVFRQVLHFGVQNLYDPELDEWMIMKTFSHGKGEAGEVELPAECVQAAAAASAAK